MSYIVVIPARFGSTRLEGKPLLDIQGKPMIQRVYEQAQKSEARRVIVATDDPRIESVVKDFGGEVVMTSANHESGTDRLQEVADICDFDEGDVVVNVQGDEPLIPPDVIDQVADNLRHHVEASVSTLCEEIFDLETIMNPNAVKVVFDSTGFAVFFRRSPIPYARDFFDNSATLETPETGHWYRHIGIYAYRVSFLHRFVDWPMAELEAVEKLEQLRAMANGMSIHVAEACEEIPAGVDTDADLQRVRTWVAEHGG